MLLIYFFVCLFVLSYSVLRVSFLFPLISAARDMNLLKPGSKGVSALTKMLILSVSQ